MSDGLVVVAGAGGFIGGHMVKSLLQSGASRVRAVDIKPEREWRQRSPEVENLRLDLSQRGSCCAAVEGAVEVYNFASDMGGMGFIERHKALCMLSVLINTHLLMASRERGVERFFFASSACVYPAAKQSTLEVDEGLREDEVYPAMPEDGYGWEKLFGERMCRHFSEDFGLETRVGRYHNVYGPYCGWDGGREKAPAAICRKVFLASRMSAPMIEIWGDGEQRRSFTYIDDCIAGTTLLMRSDVREPLNIGSDKMVSIDQLARLVEKIAGTELRHDFRLDAPLGVRGRNSNNERIRELLDWSPTTPLRAGLAATYSWIRNEIESGRASR